MNKAFVFSIILIILSIASISIRFALNDSDSVPVGDSLWELTWSFELTSNMSESEIRLATPIDTQFTQVLAQNIALQGVNIGRSRSKKDGTREIIARTTQQKDIGLDVNFVVRVSPVGISHFIKKKDELNAERRQIYTTPLESIPSNHEDIQELANAFLNDVEEPGLVFNALFDYCTTKIRTDSQSNLDSVFDVIRFKEASVLGKVRLLTTLARAVKIPARIVMGLILEEENDMQPHYWMEININDKWLSYDPSEGYVSEVPPNFLPIRKNGDSFLILPEPIQLKQKYLEVTQRDTTIDFTNLGEKRFVDILDLNRLSLSTRLTLALLLLLPLGALITVLIRQVIGPNVYGTFTPTFLALSLIHVGWKSASIILCIVTLIGIVGRFFTTKFELNRVSRLTIVFILVAISMIFSVSLMVHYGLAPDGSIVLLPIVILTFMIDQIYRLADSDGVKIAMIRLLWTFIVAAIVATVLQMNLVGLWIVSYPEVHLITAAFVIMISLYKGQKWMQKIGLNWMLEPKKAKTKKNKAVVESEIT